MRIRIEAPSSPFPVDKLAAGVARLRAAGHVVDDSAALRALAEGRHAYLAHDDEERRRSLQDALASDADVVWLARGGYGLTRLLATLELPQQAPTLIGFSDATALFAAATARASRVRMVHGPLATTIAGEPAWSFAHCLAVLEGRAAGASWPLHGEAELDVEGWVFAANLCVLAALCGTPSLPSLKGAVLVLEEVGERPYRIDRLLTQLLDSGALKGVRAVIVGHLTGCAEPSADAAPRASASAARDPPPAPLDVFRERARAAGVPLAHGLPVGHEAPNVALPLGARVHARVSGGSGSLTLLSDAP